MSQRLVSAPSGVTQPGAVFRPWWWRIDGSPSASAPADPCEDLSRDALAPGIAAAECGADAAEVGGGEDVGVTTDGDHGAPPVGLSSRPYVRWCTRHIGGTPTVWAAIAPRARARPAAAGAP